MFLSSFKIKSLVFLELRKLFTILKITNIKNDNINKIIKKLIQVTISVEYSISILVNLII